MKRAGSKARWAGSAATGSHRCLADDLNDRIREWDARDEARRINDRIRTTGQDFTHEQPFLAQLPAEAFDPGLVLTPRVDRSSMISVRIFNLRRPK